MTTKIGNNIKKCRHKRGISQDQLSKRSGLAFHTIAKIETGITPNPTIDTIKKIADALKVSVDDLIKQKAIPDEETTQTDDRKKYLLFTPGPVNVAESIRRAIAKEDICHREEEFDNLLQRINKKLLQLFEVKNPAHYKAVIITGSGTAANESILSSVVGDKNILIVSNGEFGERLYRISKMHNKNTFWLKFPWGEKIDLRKLENTLKEYKIDVVAMVHHETSSGMLNSLEDVGIVAKAYNAMFVVDCVSSAGAEIIDMEKFHISFCSSSSGKAIASYPGLSFVIGRKREFEKLKDLPAKSTYLNLYTFYHYISTISQTPNTPAVPLFYALEQALTDILKTGISSYRKKITDRANLLRSGMKKIGLKFLIEEKNMSSILTTVCVPKNIRVHTLQQKLREKNIIIYAGKGDFKDRVFQVGNIGDLSTGEIRFFLDSLQKVLQSLSKTFPVGNTNSIEKKLYLSHHE